MAYGDICEIQAHILPVDMSLTPGDDISPHFRVDELSCRHCGKLFISPILLHMLEDLRLRVDAPLRICSGYRCPEHNRNIGGSRQSAHMMGLAADIAIPERYKLNPAAFIEAAEAVAREVRGGYHFYPRSQFVHIDCRPYPPDRRW